MPSRANVCLGALLALVVIAGCQPQGAPTTAVEVASTETAPTPAPTRTPWVPPSDTPSEAPAPASPGTTPKAAPSPTPAPVTYKPAPPWEYVALGDSHTYGPFSNRHEEWNRYFQTQYGMDGPRIHMRATPGFTVAKVLANLDASLDGLDAATYVGVLLGTNDCYFSVPLETYRENLKTLINRLREKGKTPILATFPLSYHKGLTKLPEYLTVLESVRNEMQVAEGPDFYEWTRDDQSLIKSDQVHLTLRGNSILIKMWGESLARHAGLGAPLTPVLP